MKKQNGSANSACIHHSKRKLQSVFFLVSFLLPATSVIAEAAPDLAKPKIIVPEMIAGVETVNAEQVIEQLTSEHPPLLVDARIKKRSRLWTHRKQCQLT